MPRGGSGSSSRRGPRSPRDARRAPAPAGSGGASGGSARGCDRAPAPQHGRIWAPGAPRRCGLLSPGQAGSPARGCGRWSSGSPGSPARGCGHGARGAQLGAAAAGSPRQLEAVPGGASHPRFGGRCPSGGAAGPRARGTAAGPGGAPGARARAVAGGSGELCSPRSVPFSPVRSVPPPQGVGLSGLVLPAPEAQRGHLVPLAQVAVWG